MLLHPGEYSEAASELVICFKKTFSSDLPESSGEDDLEVDDAPELMDVLVDTLLSLLPQSSAPMRSSIDQVIMKIEMFSFGSFVIIIHHSIKQIAVPHCLISVYAYMLHLNIVSSGCINFH